jgi:hypothetical protein
LRKKGETGFCPNLFTFAVQILSLSRERRHASRGIARDRTLSVRTPDMANKAPTHGPSNALRTGAGIG